MCLGRAMVCLKPFDLNDFSFETDETFNVMKIETASREKKPRRHKAHEDGENYWFPVLKVKSLQNEIITKVIFTGLGITRRTL